MQGWHCMWISGCRAALTRVFRDRRGTSAMEFATIGTLMAGAFIALVDLGNVAQQRIQLQEAVRAGGSFAAVNPTNSTGIVAAVKNAVPSGWSTNMSVPVPTTTCICWNSATSTESSCAGSGTACGTGLTVRRYISVSASVPYSALMSGITSNTATYMARYE